MNRLIEETMKRSILLVTMIVLIMIWGGISALQIQRDYLPEINNPTLSVTVRAENFQAEQIKSKVTDPIQQAVSVVDGLKDIETNSFNGGAVIRLNFSMNDDMQRAEGQVTKALENINLPAGVEKPSVSRLSTHSMPIMRVSLVSNSANITENTLRTAIQGEIVNRLKSVPGVKDVRVSGGGNAGYEIHIRDEDLKKENLTIEDIKQSLEENFITGIEGKVSNNQVSIPIQVSGWGITQQDLLNRKIHTHDGKNIPLSAVADITNTAVNVQTISRTNGEPSVLLDVLKTPSSNITDVSKRINERLKEAPALKNKDIQLSILFNQAEQVNGALKGLIKEGLLGSLFSMISVFLFFRKIRSTLLIAVSLPICLLAATGILKMMGISLNILTISGLIVAMGRVVDDSIVILDNMNRKISEKNGKNRFHLLTVAVREMIPAIVASTATTIAVYVPIALIGGMVSSAFSGFAWSVVLALVISLFVSIMVVPALYTLVWRGKPSAVKDHLEPFTAKFFIKVFQHKGKTALAFLALFLVISVGAFFLPVNFLPNSHFNSQLGIQVEMPQNSSLAEVDAEVKRLEAMLKSNPEVASFSSGLGSNFTPQSDDVFDTGGGWIQKQNIANLAVVAKKNTNIDGLMAELQKRLNSLPSKAVYTVSNQNTAGDDSQLKINISGADSQTLETAAQTIRNQLKLIPGLAVQGTAESEDHETQYQIELNRRAIEKNGIKLEDVLDRIKLYTAEGTKGTIRINYNAIPVVFHTDKQSGSSKDIFSILGDETFLNSAGQKVPLSKLSRLTPFGSPIIEEKDGTPYASVTANILSKDIGKVTKQVKTELENIPLPEGINYSLAGAPQQVYEMIYEMSIAIFFSILLVMMIVSTIFRGWRAPLSVLACIPLAFIGSIGSMLIFKLEWNLAAFVGMLMLTGIVVTNGIVLVDKIERNLHCGMEAEEAIVQGAISRTRPILSTAVATVLTVMPLALSSRTDTLISQTLGIVVIGGIISSTLTSLLMIPIIYKWLYTKRTAAVSEGHGNTTGLNEKMQLG